MPEPGHGAERRSSAGSTLATAAALLALAALVLASFAPAFGAEFVQLDDDYNLLSNPHYRGLARENLAWMVSASWNGNYQPLAWASYAVDYALGGGALTGMDPSRYHATNVLLHLATAIAFFFLARELIVRTTLASDVLAAPITGGRPARVAGSIAVTLGALLAAVVFAVHPLRAESVAWVTDRNDLLAGGFAVLAALAWLRFAKDAPRVGEVRRIALPSLIFVAALASSLDTSDPDRLELRPFGAVGLAVGFGALGFAVSSAARAGASRPAQGRWYAVACAAFLPSLLSKGAAVALPLVLLVLDVWPLRRLRGNVAGALLEKAPLFAMSLAAVFVAGWARQARIGTYEWVAQRTIGDRAAQVIQSAAYYPAKTIVPRALVPIVDVPVRADWLASDLLLPTIALSILAVVLAVWRARVPALLAACAAYVLLAAPTLGFVPFGSQLVSDRYSYVACMPFAVLAGAAWVRWWRAGGSGEGFARLALPVAVLATAGLSVLTWRQTAIWKDSESLWAHQLRFDETPRALTNLAMLWNERAAFDPERREEWLARAESSSRRALELAHARGVFVPEYRLHLGTILLNGGKLEEARTHLEWFVGERPDNLQGWSNLGLVLVREGHHEEAVRALQRAVERTGGSADTWRILGLAFEGAGKNGDAVRAYRRSLALAPDQVLPAERLRALEAAR